MVKKKQKRMETLPVEKFASLTACGSCTYGYVNDETFQYSKVRVEKASTAAYVPLHQHRMSPCDALKYAGNLPGSLSSLYLFKLTFAHTANPTPRLGSKKHWSIFVT